jgi:hypothetical protein
MIITRHLCLPCFALPVFTLSRGAVRHKCSGSPESRRDQTEARATPCPAGASNLFSLGHDVNGAAQPCPAGLAMAMPK